MSPKGMMPQKKMSVRARLVKAENMVVALVEERTVIRDLIMDRLWKLTQLGFTAVDGDLDVESVMKLEDTQAFRELGAFAQGVPDEVQRIVHADKLHQEETAKKIKEQEDDRGKYDRRVILQNEQTPFSIKGDAPKMMVSTLECGHMVQQPMASDPKNWIFAGMLTNCTTCEENDWSLDDVERVAKEKRDAEAETEKS